jgi:hypothetical protein
MIISHFSRVQAILPTIQRMPITMRITRRMTRREKIIVYQTGYTLGNIINLMKLDPGKIQK